jgi:hypothetical protein
MKTKNKTGALKPIVVLLLGALASMGAHATTYQLRVASPGLRNTTVPATATFSVTSGPGASYHFSDTVLDGVSATPATFALKNTGTKQGSFAVPALTGAGASNFAAASTCIDTAAGQDCSVSVSFSPKSVGATSATLALDGKNYVFDGAGVKLGLVANSGGKTWADGSVASSCNAYLAGDARHGYSGATGDGVYRIQPPARSVVTVYCDMATDGGGWSLVAVTSSGSIAHVNAAAVGTIVGPTTTLVGVVAKLSDADINAMPKTYYRMVGIAGAAYTAYFDGTTAFTSAPDGSVGSMPKTRAFTVPTGTTLPASPTWSAVYTQSATQAGITSQDTGDVARNGGAGGAIYGAAPYLAADYQGSVIADTAWMANASNNSVSWGKSPFTRGTDHRGTAVNIWVR